MKNDDIFEIASMLTQVPQGTAPRATLEESVLLLAAALDAATEAIMVVDAKLAVVLYNHAAMRTFALSHEDARAGRPLCIPCPANRDAIQRAVAAAIADDRTTALRMHDLKGATSAFCRVLPPEPRGEAHALRERRALALIVCRSAQVSPDQIRVVCELSGLSQAECRVAELLVGGANPRDIARSLGCSIHTVRAHLKQIFYKTNTARQAEFIALVRTAVA